MAGFGGFQDAVKRVIHTNNTCTALGQNNSKGRGSLTRDSSKEQETWKYPPSRTSRMNSHSFQKIVKKVVHTQSTIARVDYMAYKKRVLYPTKPKTTVQKVPVLGGTPITVDTAVALRTQAFGGADLLGPVVGEWLGQSFCFQDAETTQAYSLRMHKACTKGLAMCVQGYILKHLLFSRRGPRVMGDPAALLRATTKAQEEALVGALSDILWKAGERQRAVLCLTQDNIYVTDDTNYQSDGCTEKIHTFEFKKQDELTFNLKKYLFEFLSEDGNGLLLFLYSVILSRGFQRLAEDLDGERQSLALTNAIHPCLATLLLTGRATRHLHNGIIYEGSEDTMAKPKTGILTRSEVGLLVWHQHDLEDQGKAGSRLKTPCFPVWVTRCNDSYGLLFNPNKELTRDYHAENRFDLYYFSNANQSASTIITIDTRNQTTRDDYQTPALEHLIHTKWHGADVSWNGTAPYV